MIEHSLRVRRTARFFTAGPENAEDIWVILHGYGQTARSFIQSFEDLSPHALIVAPEALSRFYVERHGRVGASWMTREDRTAEIDDYLAYLDAVLHALDKGSRKLNVLGFSQGGHTASRWAAHRARMNRLVLWGSTLPEDIDEAGMVHALADGEISLVVGRSDPLLREDHLSLEVRRIDEMGLRPTVIRYAGGHEIDVPVLKKLMRADR